MERINETQPIRSILERASHMTRSEHLVTGYAATVIEVTRTEEIENVELFEGTVLYFPGIKAADLTTR
mgnify:CR=1 FL=1